MSSVVDAIAEQRAANRSSAALYDVFAVHRERLTRLVHDAAPGGRLCVLGAGNCNDLDLERLARRYREIHLVDLDPESLERACERQASEVRARLVRHAPVDLSGLVACIERWARFQVTPQEMIAHADVTCEAVVRAVGEGFDVVLSACMLTQMQLMVVDVMTDRHPLFEATRHTLSLTHLRTLVRLQAPGGRGFLATDLSSERIAPFGSVTAADDLRPLMDRLLATGAVFQVAHPGVLGTIAADDPKLRREAVVSEPLDVWPWQNGTAGLFLVYALGVSRRPSQSP
ncbi:MAG: hypothetical protein DIU78_017280 [Pseudomonadota bacterium]